MTLSSEQEVSMLSFLVEKYVDLCQSHHMYVFDRYKFCADYSSSLEREEKPP